MKEKRNIFYIEEFQIICFKKEGIAHDSLIKPGCNNFLPKNIVWKQELCVLAVDILLQSPQVLVILRLEHHRVTGQIRKLF